MTEPKWLTRQMVLAIHAEAVWRFGGLSGVRDHALLESTLERPRSRFCYEPDSSLYELAANLGFGLIENRPFNDGNKRTGLLTARAFLFLNGCRLEPEEADEAATMVGVDEGSITEATFAHWLAANAALID